MFESMRSSVSESIEGSKAESEEREGGKSSSSESTQSLMSATWALHSKSRLVSSLTRNTWSAHFARARSIPIAST